MKPRVRKKLERATSEETRRVLGTGILGRRWHGPVTPSGWSICIAAVAEARAPQRQNQLSEEKWVSQAISQAGPLMLSSLDCLREVVWRNCRQHAQKVERVSSRGLRPSTAWESVRLHTWGWEAPLRPHHLIPGSGLASWRISGEQC